MNILMFSINPIYPKLITGGASKHLHNIANYMAIDNHKVTILCSTSKNLDSVYELSKNIFVEPILPFKQPFPNPYEIDPGSLAYISEIVGQHIKNNDRFYIHDGELLLPFLAVNIPTIISFRDNIYSESIIGSFISRNADEIITISPYSFNILKYTVGRIFSNLEERLHLVLNGIDFNLYKPIKRDIIYKKLNLDINRDIIILHPHRPEQRKGLIETFNVVKILKNEHKISNIKVLVPQWIEEMNATEDERLYREFIKLTEENSMSDNFIFHEWLSQDLMPEYYSMGAMTYCLGSFVETFGNVAYESLACGTPSIVSKVGVHRELLPDDLIFKVDPFNPNQAAMIAQKIINERIRIDKGQIQLLKKLLDINNQLRSVANLILKCKKKEPLKYQPNYIDDKTTFKLAPWCYISNKGIYHDYKMLYFDESILIQVLREFSYKFNFNIVKQSGVGWKKLNSWYKDGLIVPCNTENKL